MESHSFCVEIRGNLASTRSFLPISRSERSHSGYQSWQEVPLLIEASHWSNTDFYVMQCFRTIF